jgi:hypothetical protein
MNEGGFWLCRHTSSIDTLEGCDHQEMYYDEWEESQVWRFSNGGHQSVWTAQSTLFEIRLGATDSGTPSWLLEVKKYIQLKMVFGTALLH